MQLPRSHTQSQLWVDVLITSLTFSSTSWGVCCNYNCFWEKNSFINIVFYFPSFPSFSLTPITPAPSRLFLSLPTSCFLSLFPPCSPLTHPLFSASLPPLVTILASALWPKLWNTDDRVTRFHESWIRVMQDFQSASKLNHKIWRWSNTCSL